MWGVKNPYYVAGFNYRRSTSHGAQNLHRGEDIVPTGPDSGANAEYPRGVVGMPIYALADGEVLALWDNDSVGGYHQAVVVSYPDLGVDVLYGHVRRGSMLRVGTRFGVWDVICRMGTRYDADPGASGGRGGDVDARVHVQVAPSSARSKWIRTLGQAFNDVAIDPRVIRMRAGEPDLRRVPYHGPNGPTQLAGAFEGMEIPNLACGDGSVEDSTETSTKGESSTT